MKLNIFKKSYPLLLGTWILRSSNDKLLHRGISYIIINNDDTIKFRTLYQESFFGIKKSISGKILNITNFNNCEYSVDLVYSQLNKYSYSIFGVEIPEFKSETKNNIVKKQVNVTLYDKSLLVQDCQIPVYYLFDLQIGKIQQPFIETGLNNFIFTQTVSFLLNLILAKILHNIFFLN